MKWIMMLGGFVLYAVLATLGVGWLLLSFSPTRSSYGDAVVLLMAPVAGVVFGVVGMWAGYYVHKKEYVGAAAVSVLLTFSIAIVFVALLGMF